MAMSKLKSKAVILYGNENGEDVETELPTCWAICGSCQGHGTDHQRHFEDFIEFHSF